MTTIKANETKTPDTEMLALETVPGDTALKKKLALFGTPGLQIEFDPVEAGRLGAFVDDALSDADAEAASTDPEIID